MLAETWKFTITLVQSYGKIFPPTNISDGNYSNITLSQIRELQ